VLLRPDPSLPTTADELLGPELLERLSRLDVATRRTFAGKMQGERRSKRRGTSVEFDDFRAYTPGDDLRRLDWNVYARLDRLVLKLFKEDEDLSVRILLDASPSMDAGGPTKRLFAARLAFALASIALINMNRVSVSRFGERSSPVPRSLAPLRGRRSIPRVADFILDALHAPRTDGAGDWSPGEPGGLVTALRRIASDRPAGQGVVVLVSDLLVPGPGELARGRTDRASPRGFAPTVLHVRAPGELDPEKERDQGLVGDLRLTDAESGEGREVTLTPALVDRYRAGVEAYLERVSRACAARGITHRLLSSDEDLASIITGTLRRAGLLG